MREDDLELIRKCKEAIKSSRELIEKSDRLLGIRKNENQKDVQMKISETEIESFAVKVKASILDVVIHTTSIADKKRKLKALAKQQAQELRAKYPMASDEELCRFAKRAEEITYG